MTGPVPPLPPPHHKSASNVTSGNGANDDVTFPPNVQGKRVSGHDVAGGLSDYDIPRSAKDRTSFGDYDIPRSQKEHDVKEKLLGVSAVPQPQAHSSPIRQLSGEISKGIDYDIPLSKEERLRKEKVSSILAHKSRCGSESSSDASRPDSVTSSVYSADASSISLNSSRSSSKLTLPKDEEYEHSRLSCSGLVSQSSFEQQLDIIDQLVDDIAEQNAAKKQKSSGIAEESANSGDGYELPTLGKVLSARSSNSEGSSNSGSQDNLGVWDDVSYEEDDSDDLEGECVVV